MELSTIRHDADSDPHLLVKFTDGENIVHEIRLAASQISTYKQFQQAAADKLGVYFQRNDFLRRGGQENWEYEVSEAFAAGKKE